MQEVWVQSLGKEDSLEKEMATHSRTLTLSFLENPMKRGTQQATVHGVTKESAMTVTKQL